MKISFHSFKGSDLKEKRYTPLFPYFANVRLIDHCLFSQDENLSIGTNSFSCFMR